MLSLLNQNQITRLIREQVQQKRQHHLCEQSLRNTGITLSGELVAILVWKTHTLRGSGAHSLLGQFK
jgi:hypothetical protein